MKNKRPRNYQSITNYCVWKWSPFNRLNNATVKCLPPAREKKTITMINNCMYKRSELSKKKTRKLSFFFHLFQMDLYMYYIHMYINKCKTTNKSKNAIQMFWCKCHWQIHKAASYFNLATFPSMANFSFHRWAIIICNNYVFKIMCFRPADHPWNPFCFFNSIYLRVF